MQVNFLLPNLKSVSLQTGDQEQNEETQQETEQQSGKRTTD